MMLRVLRCFKLRFAGHVLGTSCCLALAALSMLLLRGLASSIPSTLLTWGLGRGMFGKGIYFADCPLKSWRYCFPSAFVSKDNWDASSCRCCFRLFWPCFKRFWAGFGHGEEGFGHGEEATCPMVPTPDKRL